MRTPGSKVKKDPKKLAKTAMKQLADEPLEILKTAKKQVSPTETNINVPEDIKSSQSPADPKVDEDQLKATSQRRLQALEQEIEDIRKSKKQKEEEKRQQEEIERQKLAQEKKQSPLVEPAAKRKRGLMAGKGMKSKLEKLKRKSEIRMPPSG